MASRHGLKVIRALTPLLLMSSFALTVAVMLPGIGVTVNGATRWLGRRAAAVPALGAAEAGARALRGRLLAERPKTVLTLKGLSRPLLLVVGLSCALLMKQPDMGTAMVICFAIGALLIAAGTPIRHLGARSAAAGRPGHTSGDLEPYRRERLTSFLDPFADAGDTGFQAVQALTAIGSGGFFGVGLGESVQKIFYLPEAHTDMILAIIGEELGLVGILGVDLVLYGMIGYAGLRTAKTAGDPYSKLLAAGITLADPLPGHAQLLRRARHGAAHRRAAAVHLLRQHQPDRAAGRHGPAAERRRHRRAGGAQGQGQSCPARRSTEAAMPKIVIAAGGTAGHVVPALAVADALRASGAEVEFAGGERAEAELVPAAGYPLHRLEVVGIDRRNPLRAARAVALALRATGRARRLLRRIGADAVLGGGGYVAGPVGPRRSLAAAAAGAHRGRQPPRGGEPACSRRSPSGSSWPSRSRAARPALPRHRAAGAAGTGTADRGAARERFGIDADEMCLLVFGGSLGARRLNEAALDAFGAAAPGARPARLRPA